MGQIVWRNSVVGEYGHWQKWYMWDFLWSVWIWFMAPSSKVSNSLKVINIESSSFSKVVHSFVHPSIFESSRQSVYLLGLSQRQAGSCWCPCICRMACYGQGKKQAILSNESFIIWKAFWWSVFHLKTPLPVKLVNGARWCDRRGNISL
jgi:hypothetical protein